MTEIGKPLYFGPKNLFGWLYLPARAAENVGVVIVSPHGYDMMCMHWGLRLAAETLAGYGFPVLRFDVHGTGDSPGDDEQPDRVAVWLDSIHDAIEMLKRQSNISKVVLLGVRLGGTLASVVASSRDDVTGLILYAPCVTGRQYVRELKALAAMTHGASSTVEEYGSSDVVMAGWVLTEQTVNDLGQLDISKLAYKDKQVLYIHREDISADQKLLEALQVGKVSVHASTEYKEFAQDALLGNEPTTDFQRMAEWLRGLSIPSLETQRGSSAQNVTTDTMSDVDFIEKAICFGARQSLFGILCMPKSNPVAPCVIFISTAANHHIGTHRTTVEIARKLAANGIGSLRMDVAGVGDSPVIPGRLANQIYFLPAIDDVFAAIGAVAAQGARTIALTGTCSGAYLAYNAARLDSRVSVLATVNLHRFIWRETDRLPKQLNASTESLGSYLRKMLNIQTWRRLVSGGIDLGFVIPAVIAKIKKKTSGVLSQLLNRFGRDNDKPNQVVIDCSKILDRGSHIDMIYSDNDGGMDEVAFYLGNRGKMLKDYPGFSFREVLGADHTFTTKKSRNDLLEIYIDCIRNYERSNRQAAK